MEWRQLNQTQKRCLKFPKALVNVSEFIYDTIRSSMTLTFPFTRHGRGGVGISQRITACFVVAQEVNSLFGVWSFLIERGAAHCRGNELDKRRARRRFQAIQTQANCTKANRPPLSTPQSTHYSYRSRPPSVDSHPTPPKSSTNATPSAFLPCLCIGKGTSQCPLDDPRVPKVGIGSQLSTT